MSINSNLTFAQEFVNPISAICAEAYKKTWSAENRVLYTSRIEKFLDFNVNRDIIITINPKFIKDFSGSEKLYIYEILRLASIDNPSLSYLIEDLQSLFKKRGYTNERYFYLTSLTNNQFAYEIDCKLTPGAESRRTYYRKRSMKFGIKQLTLTEVLYKYFFTDFIELNRPKAKKKVRHKGYRDHGSLGSEFSKTLKQQSNDWSLRDAEEQRNKKKQDFLDFLSGFAGLE